MSAQPEVAITIMTGGHGATTAAAGTSTTEGAGPAPTPLEQLATVINAGTSATEGAGPAPTPLEQLATVIGAESGAGGAPTPTDLSAFAGATLVPGSPTPSEGVIEASASGLPTPLDLDALAAGAEPAKKSATKKAPAKRARS